MPRDRRISAPHDVLTTPSVLECGAEHLSILGFCLLGGVVNGSHALLLECLADGSVHHLVTVNGELLPEAALHELVPVLSDVLVTSDGKCRICRRKTGARRALTLQRAQFFFVPDH